MKLKILIMSVLMLVLMTGCQTVPETSEFDINSSESLQESQNIIYESIMFADNDILFDLNTCHMYKNSDELQLSSDGDFLKVTFTLKSYTDGAEGGKTFINVKNYEKITIEEAFKAADVPVTVTNKMFNYYIDVLNLYMAYYDEVTDNEYFIYRLQDGYCVVSEDNHMPSKYDECRILLDRYIVLCNNEVVDDEILTALTNGTLAENDQLFYVGTNQFGLNEHISVSCFPEDREITEARYVIKDWDQFLQLLDETKLPDNIQSKLNDILNDENIAIIMSGTNIPIGDNSVIQLDENNRIILFSENRGAGYAVISISSEAAKGICLN